MNTIKQVLADARTVLAMQNYMEFQRVSGRLKDALTLVDKGYPVSTDIDEIKRKYEGDVSLAPDAQSEVDEQLQDAQKTKSEALARLKKGQEAMQAVEEKRKQAEDELKATKKALDNSEELNAALKQRVADLERRLTDLETKGKEQADIEAAKKKEKAEK